MIKINNRILLQVALLLLSSVIGYAWIVYISGESTSLEITRVQTALQSTDSDPGVRQVTQADHNTVTGETTETGEQKLVGEAVTGQTPNPVRSSLTRIAGRIVDANGNGLGNIRIWLRNLRSVDGVNILRQAVTSTSGDFLLEDLNPDASYLLFTKAIDGYPAYRLDGFQLHRLPRPFEIRLVRPDLVDFEGTVVDVEHAPVRGFTLTIESLDTNFPSRTITTDQSGYFRLGGFPVGELKIYTATPEYFRITGLRSSADEYRNLALVIDQGDYSVEGQVLNETGAPVASARVTLKSEITGAESLSHANRTRLTDAAGRFEFTGLGGITHTVGVYANGYNPYILQHEFQSYADYIEIQLPR